MSNLLSHYSCRSINHVLFTLLFAILIPIAGFSQDALNKKTIKALDKRYEKIMKKNKVVGTSVAIYENGNIQFAKGYGYADKEANMLASAKTEFKVGSITKVFTCFGIMLLHEQGKLDINKSIVHYIPEIAIEHYQEGPATLIIKDIMSHNSGLPSDIVNGMFSETPPSFDWTIEKLNQHYMSSQPHYLMSYSNLGYGLLGELIERVSGKRYTDFMKEAVFNPIGMNQSYIFSDEASLSKAYVDETLYVPNLIRDQAAGSMVSTVEDMCLFIQLMLGDGQINGKQILAAENVAWMETNQLAQNAIPTDDRYGFGLFINDLKQVTKDESTAIRYIGHGGDTYAFHANFGYSPDLNMGGVVLTNSDNGARINSISRLLDTYTENQYDYNIQSNSSSDVSSDYPDFKPEEVIGNYDLGPYSMVVEDTKKIPFNVGKQKIILSQIAESNVYKIKAKLFGFLPIPVKSVQMYFQKVGDEIILAQKQVKSGSVSIISKKSPKSQSIEAWESMLGNYEVIDNFKTSFPAVDVEGKKITLSRVDDYLILDFEGMDMLGNTKVYPSDEKVAFTAGIGRNSAYTLQKLDNGNLAFMGFELKKI